MTSEDINMTGFSNNDNEISEVNNDENETRETEFRTPKKVNPYSTNRRRKQGNVIRGGNESTPESSNRMQSTFRYKSRATLKLTISGSTSDPVVSISNTTKAMLQEANKHHPELEILPWYENQSLERNLKGSSSIPKEINELKCYLHDFYIPRAYNDSITIYPKIWIGHNCEFADLKDSLSNWLNEGGHGLYRNMVQAEIVKEVGWFLFSTRDMDAGALADEMAEEFEFEVGLRWRNIDTGVKGKLRDGQKIQALILEVDGKFKRERTKKIAKFYNSKKKEEIALLPNGVRMRFVKSIHDCYNRTEKAKVGRLRIKQRKFNEIICKTSSYEIEQIDYASGENKHTLRQMIMSLKSEKRDTPLFINVDLDWRQQGYIFLYPPEFREEAECTVQYLLPILRHKFPEDNVDSFFNDEAKDKCFGLVFDDEKNMVINTNDDAFDMEEDEILGFTLDINEKDLDAVLRPEERIAMPDDDNDSVSTFGTAETTISRNLGSRSTQRKKRRKRVSNESITTELTDDGSTSSITSSRTTQTIRTLEHQVRTLTTAVEQQENRHSRRMEEMSNNTLSRIDNLATQIERAFARNNPPTNGIQASTEQGSRASPQG